MRYQDNIARALATLGDHLDIGRGGFTLHYDNFRLSGYDSDIIKHEAIAAGFILLKKIDEMRSLHRAFRDKLHLAALYMDLGELKPLDPPSTKDLCGKGKNKHVLSALAPVDARSDDERRHYSRSLNEFVRDDHDVQGYLSNTECNWSWCFVMQRLHSEICRSAGTEKISGNCSTRCDDGLPA